MIIPRKSAWKGKGTAKGFESLDGYTVTLTVKSHLDATSALITTEGSVSGLDVTFELGSSDTDIKEGNYKYDIWAEHDTDQEKKYRLDQGTLTIEKSVKY